MARLDGDRNKLSEVQARVWKALEDGKVHPVKELCLLIDDQAGIESLRMMMSNIRTKVRAVGDETVICESGGYRRVLYVKEIPV